MRSVGVRELKQHISQVLRQVREQGEEYDITYYGQVVARVIPVLQARSVSTDLDVWSDLDGLAAEIGAHWSSGTTATEAVQEGRREL